MTTGDIVIDVLAGDIREDFAGKIPFESGSTNTGWSIFLRNVDDPFTEVRIRGTGSRPTFDSTKQYRVKITEA